MITTTADFISTWHAFVGELQERILLAYKQHEATFDPFGVHGRIHICRSVMFAEWMTRFHRERLPDAPDFYAVRVASPSPPRGMAKCNPRGPTGRAGRMGWSTSSPWIPSSNSPTRRGYLLEEWVSTEPVPVLAKLPVSPQDFPFLEEVLISEGRLPDVTLRRVTVDPKILEAYVGRYALSSGLVLNLERKDDRLFIRAEGFPTVEMWPESETVYSLKEINAQIVFVKNDDGEATQLLLHINGQCLPAIKV
jgi:hypothetical protein